MQWVPCLFYRVKAAGAWRSTPTQSSAKVKERVELYFSSPSGPSWPAIGRPLLYKRTAFGKNVEMEFKLCVTYTTDGHTDGMVRSRTKATEFSFLVLV